MFKTHLDKFLCNLALGEPALPEVPSNPSNSVILWFMR